MAKSTALLRQYLLPRQSRRQISGSSGRRTSSSPQRKAAANPAVASSAAKPFTEIPGPLALPMLKHSAYVLPRIGSFHHSVGLGLLEGMRDRYGDLVRLAKASRSRPVLYVFDPEMMREVYESGVTEPPRWENSPLSQHRKSVPETCPIHNDESKAVWLAIRALLQDGTLLKNYGKAFDNIATDATRRLGDLRHSENALNEELETEIYRWTLETVAMMIFGIRLGCLDGPVHIPTADNRKPEKTSMDDDSPDLCSLSSRDLEGLTSAEQMVMCTKDIADGSFLVRSEDTLVKDSPVFGRALQTFDKHFSLTEHFLKQAMEEINSNKIREEHVLLDRLRPLGPRILPLASDLLLAGVDPLAQTAISMFYHMSLHAAQQQRAHDEVHWAAASIDAGAGCPEMPYIAACAREAMRLHPATGGVVRRSKEELEVAGYNVPAGVHWAAASIDAGAGCPEMPYIAACAREAMRLHPATGGVVRRSKEELEVAGYNVPAGVDIVLAHGVTSKLEKQWGRPKAFIPERWCSEGWEPLRASKAHPLASMPFGETCPATGVVGQMLAALATRVLDKYRLEWHGPAPNMATTGVNRLQRPYYFVLQNAA
ncbi:cytochrome p450 domain-containing protein [Phthorimaea operculella]|nr:cytochrome p450 domain-containing protein [Phthorimaea operculella]